MPLSVKDGMGAWVDDFKKSDAPQFKGKSEKERREMAIAAYMSAKKGDSKDEGYVSHAQRKAVWASRADGGKGHPDKKNEEVTYTVEHKINGKKYIVNENQLDRMLKVGYQIIEKNELPFDPDPKQPSRKNSDGSTTKPMSRAKQLAQLAMRNRKKNNKVEENYNWKVSHGGKDVHVKAPHAGAAVKKAQKGFGNMDLTKAKVSNLGKVGAPTTEATVDTADIASKKAMKKSDTEKLGKLADMLAKEKKPQKESVELEEMKANAAYTKAAKDIKAYAGKSGGIDKKDMMNFAADLDLMGRAPNILQAGRILDRINTRFKGYDTDVRDRLSMYLKKHGLMEGTQLDELSPATHKSYQAKAFTSAAKGMASKRMGTMSAKDAYDNEKKRHDGIELSKSLQRRDTRKKRNEEVKEAGSPERLDMIRKAGEKINKEKKKAERDAKKAMSKDKDMMGEATYGTQSQRLMSPLQKARQDKEKADRDRDGKLKSTALPMRKKNEETVSELKKSTLGSYVNKAAKDAASKAYGAASAAKDNNTEKGGKEFSKSMKRLRGINTATKKLANESTLVDIDHTDPDFRSLLKKHSVKYKVTSKGPNTGYDTVKLHGHPDAIKKVKKTMNYEESVEEAKSFDQKFKDHLKFATSKSPAVQAYMKKRAADRDAMNKKNDPNAAKKGYALTAVPPERKNVKLRKHKQKQQ